MPLKDLKPIGVYFLSGCCSLLFIVLTFLLSRRMDLGGISEFAFMFHLLPFGHGFSGGSIWHIYVLFSIMAFVNGYI